MTADDHGLRFAMVASHDGPEASLAAAILEHLRDVTALRQTSLEDAGLLLHLSNQPLSSRFPKYGIWTFHYESRGRFLSEAFIRQTTSSGSQILERRILPSSLSNTEALSLLADAPARICRLLLAGLPLPSCQESLPNLPPQRPWHSLSGQIRNTLLTEIWHVGLVQAPIHRFLDPTFQPKVEWLPNVRPHHFFADPFLSQLPGDGLRILVEEYDYAKDPTGRIAELSWHSNRFQLPPRRVLPSSAHMSYPFLLSDQGNFYCIPESWQQNRIQLHRLDPQTRQWDSGITLIDDIPAVDSTVIHHEGRWWLFCTEKGPGVDSRLLLWHATRLEGPWSPHIANPVKVDVRSARPGGTPFVTDGVLYRPAQDCSESYGCRLSINRVTRLSPSAFSEETVRVLSPWPDWPYPHGFHTLSAAGNWTILDAKRMTFLPALAKRRVVYKLHRLRRLVASSRD